MNISTKQAKEQEQGDGQEEEGIERKERKNHTSCLTDKYYCIINIIK